MARATKRRPRVQVAIDAILAAHDAVSHLCTGGELPEIDSTGRIVTKALDHLDEALLWVESSRGYEPSWMSSRARRARREP